MTAAELGVAYQVRLPFAAPPISANEARGAKAHWSAQRDAKRDVAQAVVACVRHARIPRLERCAVTLIWYAPDYGVRDADGMYLMLKAVLDALTPPQAPILAGTPTRAGTPRKKTRQAKLGAGIIRDDNAEVVPRTTTEILLGQSDPRIVLEIVPLPALPPRPARRKNAPTRRPGR